MLTVFQPPHSPGFGSLLSWISAAQMFWICLTASGWYGAGSDP